MHQLNPCPSLAYVTRPIIHPSNRPCSIFHPQQFKLDDGQRCTGSDQWQSRHVQSLPKSRHRSPCTPGTPVLAPVTLPEAGDFKYSQQRCHLCGPQMPSERVLLTRWLSGAFITRAETYAGASFHFDDRPPQMKTAPSSNLSANRPMHAQGLASCDRTSQSADCIFGFRSDIHNRERRQTASHLTGRGQSERKTRTHRSTITRISISYLRLAFCVDPNIYY